MLCLRGDGYAQVHRFDLNRYRHLDHSGGLNLDRRSPGKTVGMCFQLVQAGRYARKSPRAVVIAVGLHRDIVAMQKDVRVGHQGPCPIGVSNDDISLKGPAVVARY